MKDPSHSGTISSETLRGVKEELAGGIVLGGLRVWPSGGPGMGWDGVYTAIKGYGSVVDVGSSGGLPSNSG